MVEAMPWRVDGPQGVLSCRKRLAIGYLNICHRHTFTIVGIDGNRHTQAVAQCDCTPDVVGVSVRDEDAPDAASFLALNCERIKVSGIVNCRVDHNSAFVSATQHDSIGTRPRHNGRIGGQNNGIGGWHLSTPCAYVQALPRYCLHLLARRRALCRLPVSVWECVQVRDGWRSDRARAA